MSHPEGLNPRVTLAGHPQLSIVMGPFPSVLLGQALSASGINTVWSNGALAVVVTLSFDYFFRRFGCLRRKKLQWGMGLRH